MSGLTTRVGKFDVPVKTRHATLVHFSGGEGGKHEAGNFAFWTAVLKEPVRLEQKDGWPRKGRVVRKIFGRAYVSLGAGDRFDRMRIESKTATDAADRRVYRRMYVECMHSGGNIKVIRPSTLKEVCRWMETHESDAVFASGDITVNGKSAKLKETD